MEHKDKFSKIKTSSKATSFGLVLILFALGMVLLLFSTIIVALLSYDSNNSNVVDDNSASQDNEQRFVEKFNENYNKFNFSLTSYFSKNSLLISGLVENSMDIEFHHVYTNREDIGEYLKIVDNNYTLNIYRGYEREIAEYPEFELLEDDGQYVIARYRHAFQDVENGPVKTQTAYVRTDYVDTNAKCPIIGDILVEPPCGSTNFEINDQNGLEELLWITCEADNEYIHKCDEIVKSINIVSSY